MFTKLFLMLKKNCAQEIRVLKFVIKCLHRVRPTLTIFNSIAYELFSLLPI